MNKIKFRVWDRKKKHFDTCRNDGDIINFSLDMSGIQTLSPKGYKIHEQYTGLQDNDGEEIYENDILSNEVEKGVVNFDKGAYFLEVKNGRGLLSQYIKADYNVIGNIHEYPNWDYKSKTGF